MARTEDAQRNERLDGVSRCRIRDLEFLAQERGPHVHVLENNIERTLGGRCRGRRQDQLPISVVQVTNPLRSAHRRLRLVSDASQEEYQPTLPIASWRDSEKQFEVVS